MQKDDFPYKHLTMNFKDVEIRFQNLKNYEPQLIKFNYQLRNIEGDWYHKNNKNFEGMLLKCQNEDYEKYNNISDYFMDQFRMKAKRYDRDMTPYDYWLNNRRKVINYAKNKFGKVNNFTLREAIYHLAGEVTCFRPTVAVSFIKMFNAKNILDFCAGWGDRLIAAIACNVNFYCGVDPNFRLHSQYEEIIIRFCDLESAKNFRMICEPFEKASIPVANYDLVITSPPYFDLEWYCEDDTQSTANRLFEEWFNDFLMFSLYKAWNNLVSGGHMVIIINDVYKKNTYTKRMVDIFNLIRMSDAEYLGVLSYSELNESASNIKNISTGTKAVNPQPCWIWKKL